MINIIDRLKEFMQYKGLNDNQITVQAGLSIGLIGKALKARKGLHSESIEKILYSFPELNPTWFITGKGDMLTTIKQVEVKPYSNIVAEPPPEQIHKKRGQCELCNEKEKRIEDLQKLIKTQEEYIEHLKGRRPAEDDKPGQKRKAG